MRTRAEYIDILSSHAGELRSQYGISSMRLFGSIARNSQIRPFFRKQIEQDGIDIYTAADDR